MNEDIRDFIINRHGSVKCGCGHAEFTEHNNPETLEDFVTCAKCGRDYYDNRFVGHYPVGDLDTSKKGVNWASYNDNAIKPEPTYAKATK